jgi:hypothetical protein
MQRTLGARELAQLIAHNPPKRLPGGGREEPIRITDTMRLINVDAGLCSCYGGQHAYTKITKGEVHVFKKLEGEGRNAEWQEVVMNDKVQKARRSAA